MKRNYLLCIFYLCVPNVNCVEELFLEQQDESNNPTFYATKFYNISVNISKYNDCYEVNSGEPKEIMDLSLKGIFGPNSNNFYSNGVLLTLSINSELNITETCMRLAKYYHNIVNNYTIAIHLKKLLSNVSFNEVLSLKIWFFKKMILDIKADNRWNQRIKFINPLHENCNSTSNCPLDRFAYIDETNATDSKIHIQDSLADLSTFDAIWCESNENGSLEFLEKMTSDSKTERRIYSATNFCKIISEPRIYKTQFTLVATSSAVLIIPFIFTLIWYLSIPKEKTLCVIYCQCENHQLYINIVKQFLRFMEENCLVRILDLTCEHSGNVLLHSNLKKPDIVIFIPFPKIEEHQRSNYGEMHLFCEKFKLLKKKVELYLPFADMQDNGIVKSDWPSDFNVFYLLQEMPRFIKFIHPYYYPQFFEKNFRKKLTGPYLLKLLRNLTFTNDHIRDLTDPKLMVVSKVQSDSILPNINLDLILSEMA